MKKLLSGDAVSENGMCGAYIILKITDKSMLKDCSFDSNVDSANNFGSFFAGVCKNFEMSIDPL